MSFVYALLIGWAVVALVLGLVFARIVRKHQESELAIPLDGEDDAVPATTRPVFYAIGLTVQTRVNQWPDGRLVKLGTYGVVIGVTNTRADGPTYHIRWDTGQVSLLSEAAMDAEVAALHRAAA